jgi:hypothetical protein
MSGLIYDAVVVGSGASGVAAAHALVAAGRTVCMIDAGYDDCHYRDIIPDRPFSELRASDPDQARYFLGEHGEGIPLGDVRVGAQLTPPRQFIQAGCAEWLPLLSDTFQPMQSLALGGLGAGWGAACFTFSPWELEQIGIEPGALAAYCDRTADLIGVSGELDNDIAPFCARNISRVQPPLAIDSNGETVLASYMRHRARLNRVGFFLGRPLLAALSADRDGRCANPYFDMEFWSDVRRSVYRPGYTVADLQQSDRFTYLPGRLALRWLEPAGRGLVELHGIALGDRTPWSVQGRSLLLCAGALNSARLAMNALAICRTPTPLLSSPYVYTPAINLHMLGRPARDARHSLTQLGAIYAPADGSREEISLQLYSYRSLLNFKLIKEIPLPVAVSHRLVRLVLSSLTIAGIFHPDRPGAGKWLQIDATASDSLPVLRAEYQAEPDAASRQRRRDRVVARCLRRLGCLPFMRLDPGHGSSIHYAGTIPRSTDASMRLRCDADYRLSGCERVFVADSSSWRYLPAKGLTFTVMANAMRIADQVGRWLG